MKIQEVKMESESEMNAYLQRSGLKYFVFGKDSEVGIICFSLQGNHFFKDG